MASHRTHAETVVAPLAHAKTVVTPLAHVEPVLGMETFAAAWQPLRMFLASSRKAMMAVIATMAARSHGLERHRLLAAVFLHWGREAMVIPPALIDDSCDKARPCSGALVDASCSNALRAICPTLCWIGEGPGQMAQLGKRKRSIGIQ